MIPEAKVHLQKDNGHQHWVIKDCPYCHQEHYHGAGLIGDNPNDFLGHRSAHCVMTEENQKGYILTLENVDGKSEVDVQSTSARRA